MSNTRLEFISSKADHLLNLLKGDDHGSKSTKTLIFLLVVYIIASSTHFIKFAFTPLLGFSIVALIGLMFIFRMSMQSAIKENITNSNYESYKDVDPVTYLRTKLQYLFSGVAIKYTRTKSMRFLYAVLFPFILLMALEIFQGRLENWISPIIFSILIGGLFWWYYFKDELEDFEIAKEDIKGYLESV